MNIGNMIKSRWGVAKCYRAGTLTPLKVSGYKTCEKVENGKTVSLRQPLFEMISYTDADGQVKLIDRSFDYSYDKARCWQLQLGVKYIFN